MVPEHTALTQSRHPCRLGLLVPTTKHLLSDKLWAPFCPILPGTAPALCGVHSSQGQQGTRSYRNDVFFFYIPNLDVCAPVC